MTKSKVLFLCTGNSARSQLAEGILRALAGEHYEIFSAGTEPKGSILPEVREAMREVGIDISGQWSKSVMEYMGKVNFGYVITVCADAEENCPAVFLNMGTREHWPFDVPQNLLWRTSSASHIPNACATKLKSACAVG